MSQTNVLAFARHHPTTILLKVNEELRKYLFNVEPMSEIILQYLLIPLWSTDHCDDVNGRLLPMFDRVNLHFTPWYDRLFLGWHYYIQSTISFDHAIVIYWNCQYDYGKSTYRLYLELIFNEATTSVRIDNILEREHFEIWNWIAERESQPFLNCTLDLDYNNVNKKK